MSTAVLSNLRSEKSVFGKKAVCRDGRNGGACSPPQLASGRYSLINRENTGNFSYLATAGAARKLRFADLSGGLVQKRRESNREFLEAYQGILPLHQGGILHLSGRRLGRLR